MIKLPRHSAFVSSFSTDGKIYAQLTEPLKEGSLLYTEAQLKQAIRDALEDAAILCNQTPKFKAYSAGVAIQDLCANKIRKLKEQL